MILVFEFGDILDQYIDWIPYIQPRYLKELGMTWPLATELYSFGLRKNWQEDDIMLAASGGGGRNDSKSGLASPPFCCKIWQIFSIC